MGMLPAQRGAKGWDLRPHSWSRAHMYTHRVQVPRQRLAVHAGWGRGQNQCRPILMVTGKSPLIIVIPAAGDGGRGLPVNQGRDRGLVSPCWKVA